MMQIELSTDELKTLVGWGVRKEAVAPLTDDEYALRSRLDEILLKAEELSELDFNDCGDSCKL